MSLTSLVTTVFGRRGTLHRKYAIAAGLFATLVGAIILLFGHFIAQSLSRRYLEDLFSTGREEAHRIANELGQLEPEELEVFEQRRERLARSLDGVPQRSVIDRIVVTDRDGNVVYRSQFEATEDVPEEIASTLELDGDIADQAVTETRDSYQIVAPIGEVGNVVLSINRARIRERVARLRRELLAQVLAVAGLTLTTLLIAFVLVWFLIQRTRRLEAKTREAEEFAALGTLAANLAHEIRNPLNSINLNLELLEEDLGPNPAEVSKTLLSTRREVGRLARLVSDFLAYARPSEPVLESVSVSVLLTSVHDFLRAEARAAGVHLRIAQPLPEIMMTSDEGQLRQILLNLVLNAVQAVAGLDAERRVVELTARELADHVVLVVRDRGDGVAEEDLDRVRTAFFTRRRGGSGLGLAIAERFAVAQGGSVELENLSPAGFEARVILPISGGGGKMSEQRAAEAAR